MTKRLAPEPLENVASSDSPASKKIRVTNPRGEALPGRPLRARNGDTGDIVGADAREKEELQEAIGITTQPGQDADDVDEPAVGAPSRQRAPAEGYTDLYLDTVNRGLLDFDFEKLCSVTLSNINVYACLVCGKYYQGRGPKSQAYFHALEVGHHVYVNMETKKVYVLPEGYEVTSKSLEDIKFVVDPQFSKQEVASLDKVPRISRDLHNATYKPGFIGLNNIKANDYFNVVIQLLSHVPPLRNFFLLSNFGSRSQILQRLSILLRKLWNPRAFKAHVSPHELIQQISLESKKRFNLTQQSDPVAFLSWFLNTLHLSLGGSKSKLHSSMIQSVFQGRLRIESQKITARADAGDRLRFEDAAIQSSITPYLILTLDLPPAPLFQDDARESVIPQVSLVSILGKYDGMRTQEKMNTRMRYRLQHPLPPYLIFHIKRFSANKFLSSERNPTIVTFTPRSLDMSPYVEPLASRSTSQLPAGYPGAGEAILYDLVANVIHEGVRVREDAVEGEKERSVWRVQIRDKARDGWVEMQDLEVKSVGAETLFAREAYVMVWERRKS